MSNQELLELFLHIAKSNLSMQELFLGFHPLDNVKCERNYMVIEARNEIKSCVFTSMRSGRMFC